MTTRKLSPVKITVLALAAIMAASAPVMTAPTPAEAGVKIKTKNFTIKIGGGHGRHFGYWYGGKRCAWLKHRYFVTGNPYWYNRWVICKTY